MRKIKNIKVNEVSLVDAPANKRNFLFFKARSDGQGTGGSIQGDGGAKYCVCPECGYSEKHEKLGENKSAPCTKIKCPECGTLMQGSDTKVLKKKKINIVIDSDGTISGTKITVNKDKIEKLNSFNFSFWSENSSISPVSCSYSKFVEAEDGFSRSETFYLTKGEFTMKNELEKQIKEYFDTEDNLDVEIAKADTIVKSLATINEYRNDFPEELKDAVGVIAKQATLNTEQEVSKSNNTSDTIKDTKQDTPVSNEALTKVNEAVAAIQAILGNITKNNTAEQTDDNTAEDKLVKAINTLNEKLEKAISDNKDNESTAKLEKSIDELTSKINKIEKVAGVKKSVEGQDADDGENTTNINDPFPSLTII